MNDFYTSVQRKANKFADKKVWRGETARARACQTLIYCIALPLNYHICVRVRKAKLFKRRTIESH